MGAEIEIWKPIDGFSGFYLVSNLGRVKSIAHDKNIGNGAKQHFKEKVLSQVERVSSGRKNGYLFVSLKFQGKRKNATVHRLVAKAFIENPDRLETVNHIDGNKHNNNVSNLEWCSYKENNEHARTNGLWSNRAKRIICIETGKIYSSIFELKKELKDAGLPYKCISQHLYKTRYKKSFHGLHFEFIDDKPIKQKFSSTATFDRQRLAYTRLISTNPKQ